MVEALVQAGVELGLPKDIARGLAAQTCAGAGKMLVPFNDPQDLKKKVTSPGGTTEAGLKVLEDNNFRHLIKLAVQRAASRAEQLGKEADGL